MVSPISQSPVKRGSSTTKKRQASHSRALITQDPERVLKRYLLWHEA